MYYTQSTIIAYMTPIKYRDLEMEHKLLMRNPLQSARIRTRAR